MAEGWWWWQLSRLQKELRIEFFQNPKCLNGFKCGLQETKMWIMPFCARSNKMPQRQTASLKSQPLATWSPHLWSPVTKCTFSKDGWRSWGAVCGRRNKAVSPGEPSQMAPHIPSCFSLCCCPQASAQSTSLPVSCLPPPGGFWSLLPCPSSRAQYLLVLK